MSYFYLNLVSDCLCGTRLWVLPIEEIGWHPGAAAFLMYTKIFLLKWVAVR